MFIRRDVFWSGELQLRPTRGSYHAGHLVLSDAFARGFDVTVIVVLDTAISYDKLGDMAQSVEW